jgi:hypothetical protein
MRGEVESMGGEFLPEGKGLGWMVGFEEAEEFLHWVF